jgi:hypothetical protein
LNADDRDNVQISTPALVQRQWQTIDIVWPGAIIIVLGGYNYQIGTVNGCGAGERRDDRAVNMPACAVWYGRRGIVAR